MKVKAIKLDFFHVFHSFKQNWCVKLTIKTTEL